MTLQAKIQSLVQLGAAFSRILNETASTDSLTSAEKNVQQWLSRAVHHNGWYTEKMLRFCLQGWSENFTVEKLEHWLTKYAITENQSPKRIGLILAGNVPLVGFHDILCVWLSGNHALIKRSSSDQQLTTAVVQLLESIAPDFANAYTFVEEKLTDFDAVIATGSDNSARYFEYYFRNKPNIIRKNRNGIAVLSGEENAEDLAGLATDIFTYFGLGCRNVSKIYLPQKYDMAHFYQGIYHRSDVLQLEKYCNNYDYNKAVFMMSNRQIYDNGFLILVEDESFSSPIAAVFYEFYTDLSELQSQLNTKANQIQCLVSNLPLSGAIPFGTTQKPELWDYADGIDTLEFLLKID